MKNVALVGCGRIAKRHIEAINGIKSLKLVALCDIDENKARKLASLADLDFYKNYKEISGADIVSILTPSGMHPKHVIEIAEHTDIKYIICEKPISLTLREAYEVFETIEKTDKVFLPVYQNRYNPIVCMIKDLICSGKLGRIYQFACNVFWNRNEDYFNIAWHGTKTYDGGVLFTQASHYVDMLHFFFGDILEYKGLGSDLRGRNVYDTVSATLKFKNGIIGTLNATINAFKENYITEFTLISENGTIRVSGANLNKIDYWNVFGLDKPCMDFSIENIYGLGHNKLYEYVAEDKFEMFPSKEDILSGIRLMEALSN